MATQNQYVDSVPLPQVDANVDPNDFMQSGNALMAMVPENQGENQPYVGAAMDEVAQEDDLSEGVMAQLGAGQTIRVTSQAQFDKMSPHEKAIVRTAMATGSASEGGVLKSRLSSRDAVTIYRDSLKQERDRLRQERADQVRTVTTSDGRKLDMINGLMIQPAKQKEPVKMEIKQAEDGTLMMIDPLTGRSIPARNENGEPVRGQAKLSATQEDNIKRLQMQSENLGSRLDALTSFTESDKVEYDTQTGNYAAAPWMGTKVKALRTQLEKEKSDYDKRVAIALRPVRRSNAEESQASQPSAASSATPSTTPTPTPTPTPNPMPTPDKFIVGRTYQDGKGRKATYRGNGVFE